MGLSIGLAVFVLASSYATLVAAHGGGHESADDDAPEPTLLYGAVDKSALLGQPNPNSAAAGGDTAQSVLSKSLHLLKGTYELFNQTETVWQLPAEGTPTNGVLFVAHGCNHGAIDWWPKSESCPGCIGLPEEMNITLHSLLRGYAVIAISSMDRHGSRCWQNLWEPHRDIIERAGEFYDWRRVRSVLATFLPRHGFATLPLYAFGASSGGGFAIGLQRLLPGIFSGVASQIMGAPPRHFMQYEQYRARHKGMARLPPMQFIHMPRDGHIAHLVAINLVEARAMAIRVHELRMRPQPLTPLYLAQRCAPEVDEATSRAIYEVFRSSKYLDEQGYLANNPRLAPDWRALLSAATPPLPGLAALRLEADASPIAEELNLLYAAHELSSETTTDMLNWFEKTIPTLQAYERAAGIRAVAID